MSSAAHEKAPLPAPGGRFWQRDTLAAALLEATKAGQWALAAELARQLAETAQAAS